MIKINYVSDTGALKETKGELFNHGGYQYCLSKTNGSWMAHELTTGHLAIKLLTWHNHILKADDARKTLKEKIITAFEKEGKYLEQRILLAMEKNEGYGLSYPINQPIE